MITFLWKGWFLYAHFYKLVFPISSSVCMHTLSVPVFKIYSLMICRVGIETITITKLSWWNTGYWELQPPEVEQCRMNFWFHKMFWKIPWCIPAAWWQILSWPLRSVISSHWAGPLSGPHLLFSFLNTDGQITPSVLSLQHWMQGASGLLDLGLLQPNGWCWKLCVRRALCQLMIQTQDAGTRWRGCLACERRRQDAGGWLVESPGKLYNFASLWVFFS